MKIGVLIAAVTILFFTLFAASSSALVISPANAEKWKIKSKNGKTKLKAKGIKTAKPLSNCFAPGLYVCLKSGASLADTNDLRKLAPKMKKNGYVKKWFYKKKKDAIITYLPKKKILKCKIWKEYSTNAVVFIDDGMEFIQVDLFYMGDAFFGEGEADEVPVHKVNIDAFYMDKYEVSNEKMREVMQWAFDDGKITATAATVNNLEGDPKELLDLDSSDNCHLSFLSGTFSVDTGKENYPCQKVTWYGSQAYCNYKSDMEGLERCISFDDWSCNWNSNGYRLPTEAEWEKAARGGVHAKRFPWSDVNTITHSKANYYSDSTPFYDVSPTSGYHPDYDNGSSPYTSPVNAFSPNDYGLYNMGGNVSEWNWDWFMTAWYSEAGATNDNTRGPASTTHRVVRGGSWYGHAPSIRCASREYSLPGVSWNNVGFRCARRIPEVIK